MFNVKTYSDNGFNDLEKKLTEYLKNTPIPPSELMKNLGLYLSPGSLGRILYMHELYKTILPIQGCVAEFGSRYGQNLSLFIALRGLMEPYNRLRKIIGFDTFEGFPSVDQKDGVQNSVGDYAVPKGYVNYLKDILDTVENMAPLNHLKKHEIVCGDVSETVPKFIDRNPHTIFALCYFDLDIYKPTKDVLKCVLPRMSKGAILAFDELNDEDMPGETLALLDSLDISKQYVRRHPLSARTSYIILE